MFVNEGRFRNRLAVTAVVIATIAMLTVPAIYAFWFHDWPIGEPRSWAEFGEFLAGTLGPIVSFATAVLLYLTLMDTRRMAMEEGVRRKREENIRLQTQRLEDTLTAWNLAIAVPFSGYV